MQCPQCQFELPSPAPRFCPGCGVELGDLTQPPAPPHTMPFEAGTGSTPWERRAEVGVVSALVETTKQVLTGPTDFYRRMPVTGGMGGPLGYAMILGYLGILVSALYDGVFRAVVGSSLPRLGGRGSEIQRILPMLEGGMGIVVQLLVGPFALLLGLFIISGLYHLCLLLVSGARREFECTFRVVCYSHAASAIMLLPLCGGVVAFVYQLVVTIVGLGQAHGTTGGRAAAAVLLPWVLLCCCCGLALALAVAGASSAFGRLH